MFIEQIPVCLRFIKGIKWRFSHKKKTIYLTFDDGPIPEITPWVLDLLDKYHIKATFFCVGENVSKHPQLYQEILRRGHQTGNHTYKHIKALCTPNDAYFANVEKAASLIHSKLFRPPHGLMRYSQIKELRKHYRIILWDVVPRDYNRKLSPEKVLQKACRYTRNGSIIVFHDSLKAEKNMTYALPKYIEYCLSKGYQFELL